MCHASVGRIQRSPPIARGLAQQEITYEGKYFCVIISFQKLLQIFQLRMNVAR